MRRVQIKSTTEKPYFTALPDKLDDQTGHETAIDHFGDASVVTATWVKGSTAAGGYQTTIGVSVARLLSTQLMVQDRLLTMLIYARDKRNTFAKSFAARTG